MKKIPHIKLIIIYNMISNDKFIYINKAIKCGLFLITASALYIIFCIGLGCFWTIGSSENYKEINQVLLNLSYSYIAGFIFYILIEYIPKQIATHKAFLIYKSDLENIYRLMGEMIAPIKMILKIKKNEKEITLEDLKNISVYKPEYNIIYCNIEEYTNKESQGNFKRVFSFHLDLEEAAIDIEKSITQIITTPSVSNIEPTLLEIISKIKSCEFIKTCKSFNEYAFFDQEYTIGGFDKQCYKFLNMYLNLRKYKLTQRSCTYQELTTQTIAEMKETREKALIEIKKKVKKKLENVTMRFNNIEYKIRNGELIK